MKEKIMYLIIGVLIGAIVTTSGFLIYNKTTKKYSGVGVASDKIKDGETYILYVNGEETASITVTGTVTANGSNQKSGNQMNYRNTKNFH